MAENVSYFNISEEKEDWKRRYYLKKESNGNIKKKLKRSLFDRKKCKINSETNSAIVMSDSTPLFNNMIKRTNYLKLSTLNISVQFNDEIEPDMWCSNVARSLLKKHDELTNINSNCNILDEDKSKLLEKRILDKLTNLYGNFSKPVGQYDLEKSNSKMNSDNVSTFVINTKRSLEVPLLDSFNNKSCNNSLGSEDMSLDSSFEEKVTKEDGTSNMEDVCTSIAPDINISPANMSFFSRPSTPISSAWPLCSNCLIMSSKLTSSLRPLPDLSYVSSFTPLSDKNSEFISSVTRCVNTTSFSFANMAVYKIVQSLPLIFHTKYSPSIVNSVDPPDENTNSIAPLNKSLNEMDDNSIGVKIGIVGSNLKSDETIVKTTEVLQCKRAAPINIPNDAAFSDKCASETKTNFDFISPDPTENADNANPKWLEIKNISSDSERYRKVRERWRNLGIPDPNKELTFLHRYGLSLPAKNKQVKRNRKRARSLSCTVLLEKTIENIKNESNNKIRRLNYQHEEAINIAERYYRFSSGFSFLNLDQCSYEQEMNTINNNFNLEKGRIYQEMERSLEMYKAYMKEVRTFQSFYQGLESNEDKTIVSPQQFDLLDDTENMYACYKRFYK